jgi:hypothetical protein
MIVPAVVDIASASAQIIQFADREFCLAAEMARNPHQKRSAIGSFLPRGHTQRESAGVAVG